MRLLAAATVALVLLLSQAAGEELAEERAGQEQGDAEVSVHVLFCYDSATRLFPHQNAFARANK